MVSASSRVTPSALRPMASPSAPSWCFPSSHLASSSAPSSSLSSHVQASISSCTHSPVHGHPKLTAGLTKLDVGLCGFPCRPPARVSLPSVQAAAGSCSTGTGPSSPSSPSRLSRRDLNEYAWVYGPAGKKSTLTATNHLLHGVHSTIPSTCLSSLGSAEAELPFSKDELANEDAAVEDAEVASPPITLASLICESFKEAKDNCVAEMARLGKDEDSEVVHDLRVVLRRLRNMLRLFYPYLDLVNELEPKRVSGLLRVLGDVRDSGAMMETLNKVEKKMGLVRRQVEDAHETGESELSYGDVKPSSRTELQFLLDSVHQELRRKEQQLLTVACHELQTKHGKRLFKNLEIWASDPVLGLRRSKVSSKKEARSLEAHEAAFLASPLNGLAPALLSKYTSPLLLHPAWHIQDIWRSAGKATRSSSSGRRACAVHAMEASRSPSQVSGAQPVDGSERSFKDGCGPAAEPDEHLCESAHDLRKHLRELRYAMELLGPAYSVPSGEVTDGSRVTTKLSKHYGEALAQVKRLQGILGDLQDLQVLAAFLHTFERSHKKRQAKANEKRRRTRKSKRESTPTEYDGISAAASELEGWSAALKDVQTTILAMQAETWNKWLAEKGTVNSLRGRYKLMKALSCKSAEENTSHCGSSERLADDEPEVNHASPSEASRNGAPSTVFSSAQPAGLEAEDAWEEELPEAAYLPPSFVRRLLPVDSTCRLWSSRSPVAEDWDECEAFPEELLPESLTSIVHSDEDDHDIPIVVAPPEYKAQEAISLVPMQGKRMGTLAAKAHDNGGTRSMKRLGRKGRGKLV